MMMKRTTVRVLALVSWASATNLAWGQEARAAIGGRVVDVNGGVVPNAEVVVTSDETGVKQKTTTNLQGNWIAQFLIPGRYGFTVTAAGFKQAEAHGITLQTADNKSIDVKLDIGATNQQINVTAEAPLIDTTSAISGTVISPKEIAEMPTSSRFVPQGETQCLWLSLSY